MMIRNRRVMTILSAAAVTAALAIPAATRATPSHAATTTAASTTQVGQHLASLPLSFEPNRGQTNSAVRFLAHGSGYSLFLTNTAATLVVTQQHLVKGAHGMRPELKAGKSTAIRLTPVGANTNASLTASSRLPGKVNYIVGRNPANWHFGIPTFAQVEYHSVYRGVDLRYYGKASQIEYDWVLHPGADTRSIRLSVAGASGLSLDKTGNLVMRSGGMVLHQSKPVVYQTINGTRRLVSGQFVLTGKGTVGFRVGQYDRSRTLVIDPTIAYSVYLGGSSYDIGLGIAVDSNGYAYVTGQTQSMNFPTHIPFQASLSGSQDAFISKLNYPGTALLYSTYLGGTAQDVGTSLALDGSTDGYAYVTGYTNSPDFPTTTTALQRTNPLGSSPGNLTGFVTVLNTTTGGSTGLQYSTYLGATSGITEPYGIAADGSHNAYIGGIVTGAGLPTKNAYQATYSGFVDDAFLVRISTTATGTASLIYGTYLGGDQQDGASSVATDGSGNAYLVGFTDSSNFPVKNAYQSTHQGDYDAFISRLDTNSSGSSSLVFSTYLGSGSADWANSIALDSSRNLYVAGQTVGYASGFPTTIGAYSRTAFGGTWDEFVAKLSYTATSTTTGHLNLQYSTYLGGTGNDVATGIGVDAAGDAYVTGYTSSANYPTHSAVQPIYGGGAIDAFVTELNPTGSALLYSTYLGGSGDDEGTGIAVRTGDVYVTGFTNSANFPSTPSTASTTANKGTDYDAFVTKLFNIHGGVASTYVHCIEGQANSFQSCYADPQPPTTQCFQNGAQSCALSSQSYIRCTTNPTTGTGYAYSGAYQCLGPSGTNPALNPGTGSGNVGNVGYTIYFRSGTITPSPNGVEGGSGQFFGDGSYGQFAANFELDQTDNDYPGTGFDSITLYITPVNAGQFTSETIHWTCSPGISCSEVTIH